MRIALGAAMTAALRADSPSNVACVLSRTSNERLSNNDMKAFGQRDAKLSESLEVFVYIWERFVLPNQHDLRG
jgi:hypothetical protein